MPIEPRRLERGSGNEFFSAGVEGDGRLWRSTMDGVDHGFKQNKPTGWQPETRANHHAGVNVTGQATLNRRDRGLVGADETVFGMPAPRCEIRQCEFVPAWIFSAVMPGGTAESEKSTVAGSRPINTTLFIGISLKWHGSTRGRRQSSPRRLRHERRMLATSTRPTPERLTYLQKG